MAFRYERNMEIGVTQNDSPINDCNEHSYVRNIRICQHGFSLLLSFIFLLRNYLHNNTSNATIMKR